MCAPPGGGTPWRAGTSTPSTTTSRTSYRARTRSPRRISTRFGCSAERDDPGGPGAGQPPAAFAVESGAGVELPAPPSARPADPDAGLADFGQLLDARREAAEQRLSAVGEAHGDRPGAVERPPDDVPADSGRGPGGGV